MSTAATIVAMGLAVLAAYWIAEHARHGHLLFWIEAWRQPYLAFAHMARDSAWQVHPKAVAEMGIQLGWIGPFPFHLHGLEFAVYVDEDRASEAIGRIRASLVEARRNATRAI